MNICTYPYCKAKTSLKGLTGQFYKHCDKHRKYFRDWHRRKVKQR